jgi:uroporphyrinogen III methyltransferase/synthase
MTTTPPENGQPADGLRGYVYIIGAGPGDPELLTLKADRVLHESDVILYDDLVPASLLERYGAQKIYTGKRKDSHHFEQEAINEEIVRHALQGRTVARLKGGDPFVFGRGGEEIDVLRQHGIRYEIVPGITAAYGASAYTEIPLTMRKLSSSVAFCTGHPVNKIQVPDADTLVYYMVASTVHEVLDAVVSKGRAEDTRVAVVQNATRYNQKVFTGTIGEFRRREKAVYSPALLIIGDNISQFIDQNWYSRKKKVLLTGGGESLYDPREYVTVHVPCRPVGDADRELVRKAIEGIGGYTVLFFPDRFSVKFFLRYLFGSGRDVRHLSGCRIFAGSKAASLELHHSGVNAELYEGLESGGQKATGEKKITGGEILMPCSDHGDASLVASLTALGNRVMPLAVYMQGVQEQEERIDLGFIDEIRFSSPSCVRNFGTLYPSISAAITVSTADEQTRAEYRRVFGA